MDTERMVFGDGAWWEFNTILTHGASRRIQGALRRFLKPEGAIKLGIDGVEAGRIMGNVAVDWEQFDPGKANDVMLLACTSQWSFGPVTPDILDEIPEAFCEQVLARMNELYGAASPLSVKGPSPLPSGSFGP